MAPAPTGTPSMICGRISSISRMVTTISAISTILDATANADFSDPVADLVQGRVWLAEDVEEWIRTHRAALDD